ncbi:MAG: hypothetical protein MK171_08350 [Pirellulales bacterium]|nr:hypothetical protein [Pirellulales bacterium]
MTVIFGFPPCGQKEPDAADRAFVADRSPQSPAAEGVLAIPSVVVAVAGGIVQHKNIDVA